MNNKFDGARKILLSKATTLTGIAKEVGLTPQELFYGESFDGVDLTDEPIEVLASIKADFEKAVLTRVQKRSLFENESSKRSPRALVGASHFGLILGFVSDVAREEFQDEVRDALTRPLHNIRHGFDDQREHAPIAYVQYAAGVLSYIKVNKEKFDTPLEAVAQKFLIVARRGRFPLNRNTVDKWPSEIAQSIWMYPAELAVAGVFELFTNQLIEKWFDLLHQSLGEKVNPRLGEVRSGEATWFSLSDPVIERNLKIPPFENDRKFAAELFLSACNAYSVVLIDTVLGYVRSHQELVICIRLICNRTTDERILHGLARNLAIASTSPINIRVTLQEMHSLPVKLRLRYRQLLLETQSNDARTAIMEDLVASRNQGSGLEINALLSDLTFDDAVRLAKPYVQKMTEHQQNVISSTLLKMASTNRQKDEVNLLIARR